MHCRLMYTLTPLVVQVVGIVSPDFVTCLSPAEVSQVFDVPLSAFLGGTPGGIHMSDDIDYFGTPTFRVHTFKCVTNVLVGSPARGVAVADAMKSSSLAPAPVQSSNAVNASKPLDVGAPLVKGSSPISSAAGETGEQIVFGLTAGVLIQTAIAAFGRQPAFEKGAMFFARPAYDTAPTVPSSKL